MAGVNHNNEPMNIIYTRPTYSLSGDKQNKAILEHFATEWDKYSQPNRYAEKRLEMSRYEQILAESQSGDVIYVYNPAIFGIGVEASVENIRKVLAKGVRIKSVLFGEINEEWANQMQVAGEIVRECCHIEQEQEREYNRGMRASIGGYLENGIWHNGRRKSYRPPSWSWNVAQRKVDIAQELRNRPAVMWIDMKIMQAWTTERIWAEYKDLRKVMPELDKIGKQWINKRRLELTK